MSAQCLASMAWRRALKHFPAPTKPIDITPILTAASLAPTSFGVQPFQIYVISNADVKSKIAAAAYQQPQVREESVIVRMFPNSSMISRIMSLYNTRLQSVAICWFSLREMMQLQLLKDVSMLSNLTKKRPILQEVFGSLWVKWIPHRSQTGRWGRYTMARITLDFLSSMQDKVGW